MIMAEAPTFDVLIRRVRAGDQEAAADVVRRYDALWGMRMPYVLAVPQAPVGDHPHYPFHVELHPPLRAPGLLKYLAGPEVGGGSMTNESDPDEKAAELRGALD